MAIWTTPRTWATGELVTAAMMNLYVRDEFLWLGGADSVSTAPPGSPVRYQRWVMQHAFGHALCMYRDDIDATYPWAVMGSAAFWGTGSISGVWTGFAALSGYVATPRAGWWDIVAGVGGSGSSQGAGSIAIYVSSQGFPGNGGGNPGNQTFGALTYIAQGIGAGVLIGGGGNNSGVVSYTYNGEWIFRPMKVA